MDLKYDTVIKQEFPNSGTNLLQTLPNTDFNITVKSEPITDEISSLITIKNEPIYEPPPFTQTFSTINTEHHVSQQSIVTETTTTQTNHHSHPLNSYSREEFLTTSTELIQTPMIPGDSFVIYELESPATVQQISTNNRQISQELTQIMPHVDAACSSQSNNVTTKAIPLATPSQHSTDNTTTVPVSSAPPPPVLLNAKLRKRHKVVIPVNPIDKRTRYNIEGTTTTLNKQYNIPDVHHPPKTLNNGGNKKIINHLIKRKNVPKPTEESLNTNLNNILPPKNSEISENLTVKEERLSPISVTNIGQTTRDSTQTETNLKESKINKSSSENNFKPIILPQIEQTSIISLTETNLKESLNTAASENNFKPIILPQIDEITIANLDTSPLNTDSKLLLESKEVKVPTPASNTELRVKCLCSLTADRSISSEKDNAELRSFFNQMFEETRRLSKKQQRKIKMSLLQAISDAEDLMEQGKCCGF